ncbi:MAG TPA: VOC family protein [Candidatus Bathyarchaeia archaeon]|nr:VOC family protein [Candidatus Bathyarchaeia archaeon]
MKPKFTYVGIRVKNLQKSIDFYTKLLGMKVVGRGKVKETRGETVAMVSQEGGFVLEINHYEKGSPYNAKYTVGEGLDHLAFGVDDLDKALKEAKSAGYPTVLEMKVEGGRWAYIEDPNGIWIELFKATDA